MLWSTRKVQSHRFQFSLRTLNACLLYLLCAGSALAMSPPPPEPSPDPIIPQIDPKPETPKLSIGLSGTDIRLSWRNAQHADYYPVYAYAEGDWYHVEDINGIAVTYDHKQYGWDMRELQFKILACKPKPWYVAMWAWEWGDNKRCSDYSNSVRLPLLDPAFSLSSTVVTLNNLSSLADGTQTELSGSKGSLDDSVDTVGSIKSIIATLRLKDSITQESQDIRWPIYLNTETFEVTSNKTIAVVAGTYDVEFLATDGDVDYVARALNITLTETQQNIPLILRTVLGDTDVTIDTVVNLPEFQFQYDPEELTDFTQPKIGVVIDGGNEVLLTLNPETGITDQYLSISAGQHNIQLTFYDGVLIKGRSDPAQENPNIVPGQPFVMDLIPLHGETTVSLDTVGGDATFTFAIPTIAVQEVGGNPSNLQVVLSLVGLNNQPEDVILSNLTYNANSDVYEAQHTYTGLQADAQMTLSLSFTDLSTEPDQLLGSCVMDDFVLNSDPRSLPCQLTLRRRAIVGGHLLAVLGINVFDATNTPVSGASVYAKRQGTGDENEDLGTLLGLTGSGSFGTAGYLKTYLVPGSYQLSAKYVPIDGSVQETITLSAFDVENQDLILDKSLDQNQPPSITLTAPASDMIASAYHKITWVASAPYQASISLYYDTNNSGHDGTLITNNLSAITHSSYVWNTSSLSIGEYHIYAKIDDGVNPSVYHYANGKVTVVPIKLNDTAITWGGEYLLGNNSTCTGGTIEQQDCSHGRDDQAAAGTLTKVGGGAAGFDFTRLNADGSEYTGSGNYNSQPWACVRDNHTGLIWEVKTDDGSIHDKDNVYRWGGKTALVTQQARDDGWGEFYDDWDTLVDGSNSANSGSGLCGLTDWRVPAVNELAGIAHMANYSPAIDDNYFPNTGSSYYWSSSPIINNIDRAWVMHFRIGYVGSFERRSYNYPVRLVAGAALTIAADQQYHHYVPNQTPDSRYTLHEDGTVTDTWTGLMWQRCSLGQSWNGGACNGTVSAYNWQQALQQSNSNNLAGYSDWRLPSIRELHSIVAYDRYGMAINGYIFPNMTSHFYWSSSPYDYRYINRVWTIDFSNGEDPDYHRNWNNAVRLVRGAQ